MFWIKSQFLVSKTWKDKVIEREKQSFPKLVKYTATSRGLLGLCCDLFSLRGVTSQINQVRLLQRKILFLKNWIHSIVIDRSSTASQGSAGLAGYNLQQERMRLRKSCNMLQAVFGWLFKITSSFFRFRFNELQISFWKVNLYLKKKKKREKSFSNMYSQI